MGNGGLMGRELCERGQCSEGLVWCVQEHKPAPWAMGAIAGSNSCFSNMTVCNGQRMAGHTLANSQVPRVVQPSPGSLLFYLTLGVFFWLPHYTVSKVFSFLSLQVRMCHSLLALLSFPNLLGSAGTSDPGMA